MRSDAKQGVRGQRSARRINCSVWTDEDTQRRQLLIKVRNRNTITRAEAASQESDCNSKTDYSGVTSATESNNGSKLVFFKWNVKREARFESAVRDARDLRQTLTLQRRRRAVTRFASVSACRRPRTDSPTGALKNDFYDVTKSGNQLHRAASFAWRHNWIDRDIYRRSCRGSTSDRKRMTSLVPFSNYCVLLRKCKTLSSRKTFKKNSRND